LPNVQVIMAKKATSLAANERTGSRAAILFEAAGSVVAESAVVAVTGC
jgi:hypothetical protein